jgi:hypothetical protein
MEEIIELSLNLDFASEKILEIKEDNRVKKRIESSSLTC